MKKPILFIAKPGQAKALRKAISAAIKAERSREIHIVADRLTALLKPEQTAYEAPLTKAEHRLHELSRLEPLLKTLESWQPGSLRKPKRKGAV